MSGAGSSRILDRDPEQVTVLPIDCSDGRGVCIQDTIGDIFEEGDEYDGLVLVIELRSQAEAIAVMRGFGLGEAAGHVH